MNGMNARRSKYLRNVWITSRDILKPARATDPFTYALTDVLCHDLHPQGTVLDSGDIVLGGSYSYGKDAFQKYLCSSYY